MPTGYAYGGALPADSWYNSTNTLGGTNGLVIIGGSTTVRGLVINRSKDNGIVLDTSGGRAGAGRRQQAEGDAGEGGVDARLEDGQPNP